MVGAAGGASGTGVGTGGDAFVVFTGLTGGTGFSGPPDSAAIGGFDAGLEGAFVGATRGTGFADVGAGGDAFVVDALLTGRTGFGRPPNGAAI